MIQWQLKVLPLKDLKDHPKNPRQIAKDQFQRLSNLIDKFGLIDKPIVNSDMTIIGGHQRVRVLKKKKVKTVECWVSEKLLSDEEIDELCIGLNLHQGKWDWDILANNFDSTFLLEMGFDEKLLFNSCEKASKLLDEETPKGSKKKTCPNCGHEY